MSVFFDHALRILGLYLIVISCADLIERFDASFFESVIIVIVLGYSISVSISVAVFLLFFCVEKVDKIFRSTKGRGKNETC